MIYIILFKRVSMDDTEDVINYQFNAYIKHSSILIDQENLNHYYIKR